MAVIDHLGFRVQVMTLLDLDDGTLAAALALGLRLWLPGLILWIVGHSAAVMMARQDPDFMAVASRSARHAEHLSC